MKAYLKQDIAKIINKKVGTVQSYVDKKLVYPEILPAQGRGFTRAYSQRNLMEFAIITVLLNSNQKFCLETIRDILNIIRTDERLDIFWSDVYEEYINYQIGYMYGINKKIPSYVVIEVNYNAELPLIEDLGSPPIININIDKLKYLARKIIKGKS